MRSYFLTASSTLIRLIHHNVQPLLNLTNLFSSGVRSSAKNRQSDSSLCELYSSLTAQPALPRDVVLAPAALFPQPLECGIWTNSTSERGMVSDREGS